MQAFLQYFSSLFQSNPGFKKTLLTYLAIVLGLGILFAVNFFYFSNQVHAADWIIRTNLSNQLFLGGVSPYDADLQEISNRSVFPDSQAVDINQFVFISPIFSLFIYFPFSLIPSYQASISAWMTINQFLLIICIITFMNQLGWKLDLRKTILLCAFIALSHFSMQSYLQASLSIVQLYLLIMVVKTLNEEDDIMAGVFMGLMWMAPSFSLVPLLVIIFTLIKTKRYVALTWSAICLLLISLAGFIFDSNWPIELVRNYVNQINFSFIYTFEPVIDLIPPGLRIPYLAYFIPIILLSWLLIEWLMTDMGHTSQVLWTICLSVCIHAMVFFQHINDFSIFFSMVFLFILYLWSKRVKERPLFIFFVAIFAGLVVVPAWVTQGYSVQVQHQAIIESIHFITVLLLVVLLYWIKWWVAEDTYLIS